LAQNEESAPSSALVEENKEENKAPSRPPISADFIHNIYHTIEREFESKKRYSDRDWMAKNTQEKP
jgi:hypothetical protein